MFRHVGGQYFVEKVEEALAEIFWEAPAANFVDADIAARVIELFDQPFGATRTDLILILHIVGWHPMKACRVESKCVIFAEDLATVVLQVPNCPFALRTRNLSSDLAASLGHGMPY